MVCFYRDELTLKEGKIMLIKNFLMKELKKLFGGTDEAVCAISKKIFIYACIYGAVILLTFALTAAFTAMEIFLLVGTFGFLFGLEIFILYTICGFFTFCLTLYYSAYFIRKGWARYHPH